MDHFFIVSVYNQDVEGVFAIFETADFMLTMKKFHLLFFAFASLERRRGDQRLYFHQNGARPFYPREDGGTGDIVPPFGKE